MIYDGLDGVFDLRLASVAAYRNAEPFSLDRFRWRNRILVVSAPDDGNAALRQQLASLAASRSAFDERDLLLVTLLDDGTSTAGDGELTNDEVTSIRQALGISAGSFSLRLLGKDGSVKLSADAATSMDEIYGLIDTMPMRRREMSDQ